MCVFLFVADPLSGINFIIIYDLDFFTSIAEAGGKAFFDPKNNTRTLSVLLV